MNIALNRRTNKKRVKDRKIIFFINIDAIKKMIFKKKRKKERRRVLNKQSIHFRTYLNIIKKKLKDLQSQVK